MLSCDKLIRVGDVKMCYIVLYSRAFLSERLATIYAFKEWAAM